MKRRRPNRCDERSTRSEAISPSLFATGQGDNIPIILLYGNSDTSIQTKLGMVFARELEALLQDPTIDRTVDPRSVREALNDLPSSVPSLDRMLYLEGRFFLVDHNAGFGVPLRHWLREDLRSLVEEVLSGRSLRDRGILDRQASAGSSHSTTSGRSMLPIRFSE